jgi:hypothetical protein
MPGGRMPHRGSRSFGQARHLLIAVILLLGAGLRVVYLPARVDVVNESPAQVELAHNILNGGRWFEESHAEEALVGEVQERKHYIVDPTEVNYADLRAPAQWHPFIREVTGPGLVLAGVWAIAPSERFIYGQLLQIAIDLAMVLVVYRIAMLLFARRRAALIAAALYALCPPIARQTTIADPDIWGLYFTLTTLLLYLQAWRSPRRGRWLIACGVAAGLGAYFRPNVLLLPLVFAIVLIGLPWRKRLRDAVAALAVAAVLLVPWTIRNWVIFHRIIPTRVGLGTALWEGLGEVHNNFGAVDNDLTTYYEVNRTHPNLGFITPAYDEYLERRALHAIVREPLFYIKLVARRIALSTVALYESAWMYHGGESPVRYRKNTGKGLFSYIVSRPLELLESLFEAGVFLLAMLALACTWRGYRRQHLLLIAVALSSLLPYWLLHFEARYVLPTLPLYLLWIALAADLLGERLGRRRAVSLDAAPVRGAANAPLPPPQPPSRRYACAASAAPVG